MSYYRPAPFGFAARYGDDAEEDGDPDPEGYPQLSPAQWMEADRRRAADVDRLRESYARVRREVRRHDRGWRRTQIQRLGRETYIEDLRNLRRWLSQTRKRIATLEAEQKRTSHAA